MLRRLPLLLCLLAIVGSACAVLLAGSQADASVATATFLLGLGTCVIAIPVSLLLARLCLQSGFVPTLTRCYCLAFLFIPIFIHVSLWDSAVGKLGWVSLLGEATFQNSVGRWPIAIWIHATAAIPQLTLILWMGMRAGGNVLEEQASLNASPASVFWHITMPRLYPLIGICVAWMFATCAREIAVTDIYRIGTLAEQIYLGYSLGELGELAGVWATLALVSISAIMVGWALWPHLGSFAGENGCQGSTRRTGDWSLTLTGLIILAPLVLVPIVNVLIRGSRHVVVINDAPTAAYSPAHLWFVISRVPAEFVGEFSWSLAIAIPSCVVTISLAILLVWYSRESILCRSAVLISVAVCCSLPGPMLGSAILWMRSLSDLPFVIWLFDRTVFGPVLANTLYCWPVSCGLIWFVLRNVDAHSIEHARLEGAGSLARLFRIALASTRPGIFGAALIAFAYSFGELSASQLAVPPGMEPIPRRMLGMLHSGVNDYTAGLTIVIACTTVLLVGLGSFFLKWHYQGQLNSRSTSQ